MSYLELWNASVQGLVEVYDFMNTLDGCDIVKMAWRKCAVPETDYNLSPECLTSRKTQLDLNQYLLKDPELRNEIERCLGKVQGINDTAEIELDAKQYDNTDVPISIVIHKELGIVISREADGHDSVEKTKMYERELIADGLEEDIWGYDQAGNRWDDIENGMVQVKFLKDSAI
ncbi:hypothetical protein ARMGADRAFT_1040742 [Armillaria gallica]|uniref:Uncharacterized protein n=1 Tax=Armillaria gallica TaxID=47427 RepID=A0A2H3C8X8_ARMGA|nr:hypothetical protein ARMGADRAFT_1040742 [Armillaria gallica]